VGVTVRKTKGNMGYDRLLRLCDNGNQSQIGGGKW